MAASVRQGTQLGLNRCDLLLAGPRPGAGRVDVAHGVRLPVAARHLRHPIGRGQRRLAGIGHALDQAREVALECRQPDLGRLQGVGPNTSARVRMNGIDRSGVLVANGWRVPT